MSTFVGHPFEHELLQVDSTLGIITEKSRLTDYLGYTGSKKKNAKCLMSCKTVATSSVFKI